MTIRTSIVPMLTPKAETGLQFVERIRTLDSLADLTITERVDLLKLAKTAALIEEHRMDIIPTHEKKFTVFVRHTVNDGVSEDEFHTAVRAVADKIKEGKHE